MSAKIFIISFVIIILSVIKCSQSIFNGNPASFNQFPYHVVLFTNSKDGRRDFCGGTLLTPTIVLTAAHCLFEDGKRSKYNRYHPEFRILAGFRHLNDLGAVLRCPKWFIGHPSYDRDHNFNASHHHLSYDYAIIKLESGVRTKSGRQVSFAGIPRQDTDIAVDEHGLLAGTGFIGKRLISKHLFFAEFKVLPPTVCKDAYDVHTYTGLCVQAKDKNTGICSGDSGSGFIVNNVVYGIVSYDENQNCGDAHTPAVFSKVSSVSNWILDIIDKDDKEISQIIDQQMKAVDVRTQHPVPQRIDEHFNISPENEVEFKRIFP